MVTYFAFVWVNVDNVAHIQLRYIN
ncbi:hypothetical protein D047_0542A, partial [Vibrio parahaemolyticus VPTS-2010_2]